MVKIMRAAFDTSTELASQDAESRGHASGHQDLRLWLRTMAMYKLITNEVRRRLRLNFNMSLARFDLMAQLDSTGKGIRMGEITSRLMVTTGNTTGLVDELVADGLIVRMPDPLSRRAFLVRITAKGRKLFRAAAKAHEDWMVEFYAGLSDDDKSTVFEILGRQKSYVLTRLSASGTPIEPRGRLRRARRKT